MELDWQKYFDRMLDWFLLNGPKFGLALVFLFVGLWVIKQINKWLKNSLQRKRVNLSLRNFLQNFVIVSLRIFLVIFVLQVAGIKLTFITAIVTGFMVAAGLALSGTLQNFVSGLLILMLRPFRIDDIIDTQGQEGKVTSIQLFYTTVLTLDNKTIIIPNGQLSNNVVINLSRQTQRRLDIDLKFNYDMESGTIKEILRNSIDSMDDILKDPKYNIGISTLETDKFTVKVKLWIAAPDFENIKSKIQEQLIIDLKTKGVKLPGMA
jgi:small conductance mechanosensitive channel